MSDRVSDETLGLDIMSLESSLALDMETPLDERIMAQRVRQRARLCVSLDLRDCRAERDALRADVEKLKPYLIDTDSADHEKRHATCHVCGSMWRIDCDKWVSESENHTDGCALAATSDPRHRRVRPVPRERQHGS